MEVSRQVEENVKGCMSACYSQTAARDGPAMDLWQHDILRKHVNNEGVLSNVWNRASQRSTKRTITVPKVSPKTNTEIVRKGPCVVGIDECSLLMLK